jgi:flagellar hook-length control protein FliK
LKPLSAVSATFRSSAADSTASAASRGPAGFGTVLMVAQRADKVVTPQPAAKVGTRVAPAVGTPAPAPAPNDEPVDAPMSAGLGREPGSTHSRAGSDESSQAKLTGDRPADVATPADLVAAPVLLPTANPAVQPIPVPAEASIASAEADIPTARSRAGRGIPTLSLSPALDAASKVTVAGRSGPPQTEPNVMPGEQTPVPSTTPSAGTNRDAAAFGAAPRTARAAVPAVASDDSGITSSGQPAAPSATPSASGMPGRPGVGTTARPAVLAGTSGAIGGDQPPVLSATPSAGRGQDDASLSTTAPRPAIVGDPSGPVPGDQSPVPPAEPSAAGGQGSVTVVTVAQSPVVSADNPLTSRTAPDAAVLLTTAGTPGRPVAPAGASSVKTSQISVTPQPAVATAATPPGPAATTPGLATSGERLRTLSGTNGTEAAALRTADQPSVATAPGATPTTTLAETLQRMTGAQTEAMASFKGPGRAAPGMATDKGPTATDPTPATAAATDARPLPDVVDARSVYAAVDPAASGLVGSVAGQVARQPPREPVSAQEQGTAATQAANPQPVPVPTGDMQAPIASAAGTVRSLPENGGSAPSMVDQIAPAVAAMAQSRGSNGRMSISITPDQLGRVHITVERAIDGTTTIHLAAEQLATLNLLRQDQSDLHRALDQAGVGQEGHSLSFSWDGGGGGMPGWGSPSHQRGDSRPTDVIPHIEEAISAPSVAAAARGGIDVTA